MWKSYSDINSLNSENSEKFRKKEDSKDVSEVKEKYVKKEEMKDDEGLDKKDNRKYYKVTIMLKYFYMECSKKRTLGWNLIENAI